MPGTGSGEMRGGGLEGGEQSKGGLQGMGEAGAHCRKGSSGQV